MERRAFITMVGGGIVAAPFAIEAQQTPRPDHPAVAAAAGGSRDRVVRARPTRPAPTCGCRVGHASHALPRPRALGTEDVARLVDQDRTRRAHERDWHRVGAHAVQATQRAAWKALKRTEERDR